jgi:hypothetical protein
MHYDAIDSLDNRPVETASSSILSWELSQHTNLPTKLSVCVGVPVMYLSNEGDLHNGKVGIIQSVEALEIVVIFVIDTHVRRQTITRSNRTFNTTLGKITRDQFPLICMASVTVHKV